MSSETWNVVLGAILGALFAVVSGAVGSEFAAWRQRCRERSALKTIITDELSEIQKIIEKMHEVWEKSKVLSVSYFHNLSACVSNFDSTRQRLFLIKEEETRTGIISLYRDLKNTIDLNINNVGSLSEDPNSMTEQKDIEEKFVKLGEQAGDWKKKLKDA